MLYSLIHIEKPMSSGMNIQALLGTVIRSNQIIIREKQQKDSQGERAKSDVLLFGY